jgi:hypothetical protein
MQLQTVSYYGTNMKSQASPNIIDSTRVPHDIRVKVTPVARTLRRELSKSCAGADVVYSIADRVLNIKHCLASKSFAALREAFNKAYPEKKVPNKTSHRLVRQFWHTVCICDRKYVRRRTVSTDVKLFFKYFPINKN